MSATLADVARLAKVSSITVSRVLNHPHLVSEKTAKRVKAAIAKTGYVPNLLAGGLVSQRSRLVVVVIPTVANRVFDATIEHLGQCLADARYQLLLAQSDLSEEGESALIDSILARRPDGLVLTHPLQSPAAREKLLARGIPVIEAWEIHDRPIDTLVGFSHPDAGKAMAEHIIERGYRKVALVWSGDARGTQRRTACEQRLIDAGVHITARHITPVPVLVGYGREAMKALLDESMGMDAVICSIDLLAQGVMAEAQSRGLRIPEDVAVMGYGNLEFAAYTHPRLTTIAIDGALIGQLIAQRLLQRLTGELVTRTSVDDVGFRLVVREST
ncbi:LacI family DNA-binding transcriptional regulator [Pseudomonas matsuisoli]|nr:LacI family DNA-binding transcriptional regulator [Pseudomonas matsuisoli]